VRSKKAKTTAKVVPAKTDGAPTALAVAPAPLSAKGEALAARLREWRATEAKRLGVPAFVVLHDRTLAALAQARPANPRQLLEVSGMGPTKVERFGKEILELCGAAEQVDSAVQ
jgi:superfamily II DNA helicase RecQ